MKSLAPKDFKSLPPLDPPAAYICVIRDIDRDRYRIEATHLPQTLISAVIAERERSFGIELVALSQTDDLPASEGDLYARHHARLGGGWLELDGLQLEELRQSMLETDAYASLYLMPGGLSLARGGAAPASRSRNRRGRVSPAARQSARRAGGEWAGRPLASHHYGYWALGRRRRRRESSDAGAAGRARQVDSSWRTDLLGIYPMAGFVVLLVVTFIGIGVLRDRTLLRGTVSRPTAAAVASPTVVPVRQAPGPTPEGRLFLVAGRAPAHVCPSRSCRLVQSLPERTQIWGLRAVQGVPVNGSSIWIEFRLQGTSFVPISYLEPLE